MKNHILLAFMLLSITVLAQTPEKMSYQAVIRDAADQLIANDAIGMQISILQGTTSGVAVYSETHAPTTNANGLVSIEIGTGTTSNDFSAIDWSSGPYFIKTEIDPTGGSAYTIELTNQLLSVPYALHAQTAETVQSIVITGTETAFDNWDKDATDDFSGDYSNLINTPSNISEFTNDAGYLTTLNDYIFTSNSGKKFMLSIDDDGNLNTEEYSKPFDYLIVNASQKLYKVNAAGETEYFAEGKNVEVNDGRIFTTNDNSIKEVTIQGRLIKTIALPKEVDNFLDFIVIPDIGFALLSNTLDMVYFIDKNGAFLEQVKIPNAEEGTAQNMDGVIKNNKLIISENGNSEIIYIDLSTYETGIYMDLSILGGSIGAFDYYNGIDYIGQRKKIYRFTGSTFPTLVAELPDNNITSIVAHRNFLFATINFADKVKKINLETGNYEDFITDINYPIDIELFFMPD